MIGEDAREEFVIGRAWRGSVEGARRDAEAWESGVGRGKQIGRWGWWSRDEWLREGLVGERALRPWRTQPKPVRAGLD